MTGSSVLDIDSDSDASMADSLREEEAGPSVGRASRVDEVEDEEGSPLRRRTRSATAKANQRCALTSVKTVAPTIHRPVVFHQAGRRRSGSLKMRLALRHLGAVEELDGATV